MKCTVSLFDLIVPHNVCNNVLLLYLCINMIIYNIIYIFSYIYLHISSNFLWPHISNSKK